MITILSDSISRTLNGMFEHVHQALFRAQVELGDEPPYETWDEIEELIDGIVDAREQRGGMSWRELHFAFHDKEAISSFLLWRVQQEAKQARRLPSTFGITEICYGLARNGAIATISYNSGYPKDTIREIAEKHESFIEYLKTRIADGMSYDGLEEAWSSFPRD